MVPLIFVSEKKDEVINYLKNYFKKDYLMFEIKPKEKLFSINDIKDVIKESSFYDSNFRVYLFDNFHFSSLEAQNAFLKKLEEPLENILYVLITDSPFRLLPTILSRGRVVNLLRKKTNLSDEKRILIEKFLKNKNLDLSFSENISISDLILFLKENINKNQKNYLILKEAVNLKNLVEKNNLNLKIVLDHLLIKIKFLV